MDWRPKEHYNESIKISTENRIWLENNSLRLQKEWVNKRFYTQSRYPLRTKSKAESFSTFKASCRTENKNKNLSCRIYWIWAPQQSLWDKYSLPPVFVLLWQSHTFSFISCIYLCLSCNGIVEQLQSPSSSWSLT
jgi:hypothetical protein